jgi:replicative DNA helicase
MDERAGQRGCLGFGAAGRDGAGMDDVQLAEQSLVATLVLAPEQIASVRGWLREADFGSPAAGGLYGRLVELAASGRVDAGSLLASLRADGALRRDGYPLSALVRWFDAVPASAHPVAYARLVVDAAMARQVHAAGMRLLQVAAGGGPHRALTAAQAQRSLLSAALRRLDGLPPGGAVPGARSLLGARRESPPSRRDAQVPHAELVTVGSLLAAPQLSASVGRWLCPDDFTDPGCGELFGLILGMRGAGVPVDRVTVTAALRSRGQLDSQVPAALLADAESSVPVAMSVGLYGRQVLSASVLRHVDAAGELLVELGRDRPGDGVAVVVAGIDRLASLSPVARRLRLATVASGTSDARRAELAARIPVRGRVPDAIRR